MTTKQRSPWNRYGQDICTGCCPCSKSELPGVLSWRLHNGGAWRKRSKNVRVRGKVGTSWGSGSTPPEGEGFLSTLVSVLHQEDMVITCHGFLAATSQGRMRLGDAVSWVRSRFKSLITARRQRKREPIRDHSGLGEGAIPNTWSFHTDIMMNFKQGFCLDVSPQVTPTRAWCK